MTTSTQGPAQAVSSSRGTVPLPDGAIVRLGRWVLAHRRLILVLWAVAFVAGAYGASPVSGRLKVDFPLPGKPGYETATEAKQLYGTGGASRPAVAVVTV